MIRFAANALYFPGSLLDKPSIFGMVQMYCLAARFKIGWNEVVPNSAIN